LSPVQVVTLLDARGEVELAPTGLELAAEVVPHPQSMPRQEVELPHVLPHGVAPDASTSPIADVVVDFAAHDQSALPRVAVPSVLRVPRRVLDGLPLCDQVIGGHAREHFRRVLNDAGPGCIGASGLDRAEPWWWAVVDEIGEIRLGIVG